MTTAPSRNEMRAHSVEVDCDRWQRLCGQFGLPPVRGLMAGEGHLHLSRGDVRALADAVPEEPDGVWQLMYASLAWGLGLKASRVEERLRALASNQERHSTMLLGAWTSARNGDA